MAELLNQSNGGFTSNTNSQWGTSGTLGSQGLYQQVTPPRQSQAAGIQGTDNRAYTRNVTDNELVRNQMMGLTNRGGAWMQNAARRAQERAFGMGLGRSSIAAGAGERAALEAAMPIAQADAATYGRAQTENMDALNRGLMQERDIMNAQTLEGMRGGVSQANMAAQERIAAMGEQAALQRQRENLAFSGEMQGLDRSQQQWMAQFGLGANMALGQQGFGFDMQRMGQQYRYDDMAAQRDFRNSIIGADFASRMQLQANWTNGFITNYWTNPDMFNPEDLQFFANSGQTLFPASVRSFRSITGRG